MGVIKKLETYVPETKTSSENLFFLLELYYNAPEEYSVVRDIIKPDVLIKKGTCTMYFWLIIYIRTIIY